MGLGTISAFLECFQDKEKMIIWIDAHADVNTRKASESGHYHGMPVAFLLGLDKDEKFPKPEQLIYVGLRDVDPFEKNQVKIKKRSTIDEYVSFNFCNTKLVKLYINEI